MILRYALFTTTVVIGNVLLVLACPDQRASNAQCKTKSSYTTTSCDDIVQKNDCSGRSEDPKTNQFGTSYSYCQYVTTGGGSKATCYTWASCHWDEEDEFCYNGQKKTETSAINTDDLCNNPECNNS